MTLLMFLKLHVVLVGICTHILYEGSMLPVATTELAMEFLEV